MMNTDMDTAARFITSLTKALQAVIHGSLDFSKHIEVGGYLYVRVDNSERVDYVLSEKLQKSDVNSMTFLSNSFHALPPEDVQQNRSSKEQNSESAHITVEPMTRSTIDEKPRSRSSEIEGSVLPHSSSKSPQHTSGSSSLRRNADHFHRPHSVADREGLKIARDNLKWPVSIGNSSTLNNPETPRSSNRTQSLTDFQTAFRSPPPAFNSQSQQSSTSSLTPSFSHNQNGSSSRNASSHPLRHHHQQQQQNKAGILPDASEMEVVHIKTEDEDDVFNIPLQCQQGGSETGADSKSDILQSQTDPLPPVSFPNIFQPTLPPSTSAAGSHLGWLDIHLPPLPTQPDSSQQGLFQTMVASQSSASSSFTPIPCQSPAQSNPQWPISVGSTSVQSRYSRVSGSLCGRVSMSRQGCGGEFACGKCGKLFLNKLSLNQHMKSHGERKFACEVCGQRFLYKHHLPRHQLAVHGAVTYNSAYGAVGGSGEQPPLPPAAADVPPPVDSLEGLHVVFENPS
ncbi:zinc finger protein 768-like isoform X3 [Littorina saxatilis]|uniref:zinc finger protein 768-like isoform X3 n=1 Tax=Littorina saxatilis TaxID=31220 RepID=UPI0038B5E677